jgi:acyl-CoA synthetase (AMP-forming)/AMP-acid ligase II
MAQPHEQQPTATAASSMQHGFMAKISQWALSSQIAFIDDHGNRLSYQALNTAIDAYGARLLPWRRTLVALPFKANITAVVAYLAALRYGIPLLLLDGQRFPLQLDELALHTIRQQWPVLRQFNVQALIDVDSGELLPMGLDTPSPEQCRPDLALLMTTSGSSGVAKAVMLSYANLAANACSICQYLPITAQDVAMTMLPLHYAYGLSVLNSHLHCGATLVLSDYTVLQPQFWTLFKKHQVQSISGVPFSYQLLRQLRLERMQLPHLRYLTQAGGALTTELRGYLQQLSRDKDWPVYLMYGQTEATARIAYLPPALLADFADCIGQAIPEGELWLEALASDDAPSAAITNALPVEPNAPTLCHYGQLFYRGPNVMLGYAYQHSDLCQPTPELDRLATGDIAERLPNGLFRIVGRASRLIKLHGKRLQLDYAEQQLRSLGFDVVLCGRDDWLGVLLQTQASPEQVQRLTLVLRQQWQLHPQLFVIATDIVLPRLSTGKIDYPTLMALLEQKAAC